MPSEEYNIGLQIGALLKARGQSKRWLADATKCSYPTICKMTRGESVGVEYVNRSIKAMSLKLNLSFS